MVGRGDWEIEIIKRSDTAKRTFVLLPRRWVMERTFAWLGRNRRLAKDFEKTLESSTAWLFYDQNRRFPLPASRLLRRRRVCAPEPGTPCRDRAELQILTTQCGEAQRLAAIEAARIGGVKQTVIPAA